MSSNEYAIRVNGLGKRYEIYATPRDRLKQFVIPQLQRLAGLQPSSYCREFWALRNVSFEIFKGETLGILGRNGSGKSTLLQLIAGILAPSEGSIETRGRIAALLELGSGFNPDFTGRENVYLNAMLLGMERAEVEERFEDIAQFADIGDHLDQPVKTYSSGMFVRLAFAVQAHVEPQVLIVDEALSVGDEKFQRKCFEYFDRLRANGCAVLLVTHSTSTVEKFCQRGILLDRGQIHGIGPAKEIVDQYHALLYSDEKAYLRYLSSRKAELPSVNETVEIDDSGADAHCSSSVQHVSMLAHGEKKPSETPGVLRAIIRKWDALDVSGEPTDVYRTGDKVRIRFLADFLQPVDEVQGGILLRTVEGVSVWGTSTTYHDQNFHCARAGTTLCFDFVMHLDICEGSYFVTLAIAEALSSHDMSYLDRKTDVIVLHVRQGRVTCTGIACLSSNISVKEVL